MESEISRVSQEITREFRRRFGGLQKLLKRDIITKEEIVKLLRAAPLREAALIATMASGGFRLGTALQLQVKHFRDRIWDLTLHATVLKSPGP